MFDFILRGGTVIDGTGAERFAGDVGVRGDQIAAVGDLRKADAAREFDVSGKIVAPGFVDVHNHSDGWMLKTPHLTPKTRQGFTTEVLMADGISYAPVNEETWREWLFYLRALDGLRIDEYSGWQSLAEFTALLDRRNVQNSICHVPYANVRSLACGFGKEWVDDFQMRKMQHEIRRGMEAGAVGVSTGLDYIVQCFSTTAELAEACSVLHDYRGLYVTHMRYKKGVVRGLQEAVEICRTADIPLHVSHLKSPNGEEAEKILAYLEQARREVDLTFDVYPYQPGSTMLNYLLPYDAWTDGPIAALSKLNRADIRRMFADGLKSHRLPVEHLHLAWVVTEENRKHLGKTLSQYIDEMGTSPEEALANLLLEERLAVLLVFDEGDDALADPFLAHDLAILGTDGIYFPEGVVHPRVYGSVGRFLGPLVRDRSLNSLERAVHKASGFPARRFGLKDRGEIRENAFADLVVFDPETISDRATYADPHQPTIGVERVFVNGAAVIADGEPVALAGPELPGRSLRYDPAQ